MTEELDEYQQEQHAKKLVRIVAIPEGEDHHADKPDAKHDDRTEPDDTGPDHTEPDHYRKRVRGRILDRGGGTRSGRGFRRVFSIIPTGTLEGIPVGDVATVRAFHVSEESLRRLL